MNCKMANKINLVTYLKSLGYNPVKTKNNSIWFLSPFRNEKTASFKVDSNKNLWYDFGEGIGGTVVDFVMKFNECSIKMALEIINSNIFSFPKQNMKIELKTDEYQYTVSKVTKLSNLNLINYLISRRIRMKYANKYLHQVHYSFKSKKEFYGIGFMNDSGGFEIRNSRFKGCLGKKDITTIKNGSDVVSLFESWSDFLSYLMLKRKTPNESFIILNSTSLVKKVIGLIDDFSIVKCYFDNDDAGERAFKFLKESFKSPIMDCRYYYKNYKDLNEYLMVRGF